MEKCCYCNKKLPEKEELPQILVEDNRVRLCCDENCAQQAQVFLQYYERYKGLFAVLTVFCIGFMIYGSVGNLRLCQYAFLAMGAVIVVFPFCTPTSIDLWGLKRSKVIGRILGVLVILVGFLFAS